MRSRFMKKAYCILDVSNMNVEHEVVWQVRLTNFMPHKPYMTFIPPL
jgi:hypothetical protein